MASSISSQQSSAVESREEFDTRMFNMVSRLEETNTIFFQKVASKSMATQVVQGPFAYSLEFPRAFIMDHGEKFGEDVTFLTTDSQRTWPINITVRAFRLTLPRVFAYGPGGWKAFLTDNHIKVGDVLFFSLIGFSRFQVDIGRAPAEVQPGDADKSSARNRSPRWNTEQAPASCRVCKHAHPCPRFFVTIRPSSHPQHLSLAVPSRFWELHGSMLECDELQLKGPNEAVSIVKAERMCHEEEQKLSVRLDSGWEAFFVANELQVGDVLEFYLVGRSCFTVDLVERIQED